MYSQLREMMSLKQEKLVQTIMICDVTA